MNASPKLRRPTRIHKSQNRILQRYRIFYCKKICQGQDVLHRAPAILTELMDFQNFRITISTYFHLVQSILLCRNNGCDETIKHLVPTY